MSNQTKLHIFPVFLSGWDCIYRCIYCDARGSSGISERVDQKRLTSNILVWLNSDKSTMVKEIAFYGNDPLSIPPNEFRGLIEAADCFVDRELVAGIRLSCRPDSIVKLSEDLLRNVQVVELGVQSMDDEILTICNRTHTSRNVTVATEYLRRKNIRIGIHTMIGLPNSTRQESMQTAKKICELKPDFVRIHPTLVLKNTLLSQFYHKGKYLPLSLDQAIGIAAELTEIYEESGIPVTRIGFHIPEAQLGKTFEAGPFHPSFGMQVRSMIYFKKLIRMLKSDSAADVIKVPKADLSYAIGYQQMNLMKLKKLFGFEIKIETMET